MIRATHVLLFSRDASADRAFLRDTLGWPFVESGPPDDGWPIFRLPPGEVGVHPTESEPLTALYLMCDDLATTVAELAAKGVSTSGDVHDESWGRITFVVLPSGAQLGLYEPRHPTAYDL